MVSSVLFLVQGLHYSLLQLTLGPRGDLQGMANEVPREAPVSRDQNCFWTEYLGIFGFQEPLFTSSVDLYVMLKQAPALLLFTPGLEHSGCPRPCPHLSPP